MPGGRVVKMEGHYGYQQALCNCPDPRDEPAGTSGAYDYMRDICVCQPARCILGMRDLNGDETTSYPVNVYNVNEQFIDLATTKSRFRQIWNSDPANQLIGTLDNGSGPFSFTLDLNSGQSCPDFVIGDPVGGGPVVDLGIYAKQYADQYE